MPEQMPIISLRRPSNDVQMGASIIVDTLNVLQDAAYRDAICHERDDPHIGTALGTGERRRLVNARQQQGSEITGGIKYYDEYNSILIFGYNEEDTRKGVEALLEKEIANEGIYIIR